MNIAKVLISFTSSVLFNIHKRRTSFDKAFKYSFSTYKCDKYRRYSTLFYEVSKDVVSKYYTLAYLYCYTKYLKHNHHNKDELLKKLDICIQNKVFSFKDLVRLWIYLYSTDFISNDRIKLKLSRSLKHIDVIDIDDVCSLNDVLCLALKYSFPRWFVNLLIKLLGQNETETLLKSLNNHFIWLRINTLKIDYDKALRLLDSEGVIYELDIDIPYLVRVRKTPLPIHELEVFKRGYVITQDKASILAVEALELEPGTRILDCCGAPGMKASLIMQLTENKAELFLADISRDRISTARKLLKNLGVDISRVHFIVSDSTILHIYRVDKILVDAPCSDSGAIPRDPAIKIHLQNARWTYSFIETQFKLLKNALGLKPKIIVYSVCSLLPWEGEGIIYRLSMHSKELNSYSLRPLSIMNSSGYTQYYFSNLVTRLFPHKHNSQGFFIARLEEN